MINIAYTIYYQVIGAGIEVGINAGVEKGGGVITIYLVISIQKCNLNIYICSIIFIANILMYLI